MAANEYILYAPSKWWKAELQGKSLTISYGAHQRKGRTLQKEFDSVEEALAYVQFSVAKKLGDYDVEHCGADFASDEEEVASQPPVNPNSNRKRSLATAGKADAAGDSPAAKKAAATAQPQAARAAASRPKAPTVKPTEKRGTVDAGFAASHPGAVVHGGFSFRVNQTNIRGNNNKYIVSGVYKTPSGFWFFKRWGRVGERGQCQQFGPSPGCDGPAREFVKYFRSKTANNWDDRDNFVSRPGKYTLVDMDEGEGGDEQELEAALATAAAAAGGAHRQFAPSKLDPRVRRLVDLLFDTKTYTNAMQQMNIDTKKMPLGKISAAQIERGMAVLEQIEAHLKACGRLKEGEGEGEEGGRTKKGKGRAGGGGGGVQPLNYHLLEDLSSRFWTLIPHAFGRSRPPVISSAEFLRSKFEMLNVLSDIEAAQGMMTAGKAPREEVEVEQLPHPADEHFTTLRSDLVPVDRGSREWATIDGYRARSCPTSHGFHILGMYRLDRHGHKDRFRQHADLDNRMLLWHGTNVAVVAAICAGGLRIMPNSGGRVGKGIYLADCAEKSFSYVRPASNGIGIMFLAEAALGRVHTITRDDWEIRAPPPGFDSIQAEGRIQPDETGRSDPIELDGKRVVIPNGQARWVPAHDARASSYFNHNEFLVYKESQARLRYMLVVRHGPASRSVGSTWW